MPTLGVCVRCGSLLCIRCMTDGDGGVYCPACAAMLPKPAAPSLRVAAHLIDAATYLVPLLIGVLIAWKLDDDAYTLGEVPYETVLSVMVATWLPAAAMQLTLVVQNGRSLGKRLIGLRVVMLDNSPVPLMRLLLLRNLIPLVLGVIPWVAILFRIADVAALYSEGNRAIHDRIAGTKVMRA